MPGATHIAQSATAATGATISSIAGVFRGRELTRKEQRLPSGVMPADLLLQGGIPRGRISEITGPKSSGKTALAGAFMAAASTGGETVAIIDWANAYDPHSLAGIADFSRILWIHPRPLTIRAAYPRRAGSSLKNCFRAAELVLEAGGFGLLVMDMGSHGAPFAPATAMRLARLAERSGTALIVIASRPLCGTFAVLSLTLGHGRSLFEHNRFGVHPLRPLVSSLPPAQSSLFRGAQIDATLTRNKLGPSNINTRWYSLMADCGPRPWIQSSDKADSLPPLPRQIRKIG